MLTTVASTAARIDDAQRPALVKTVERGPVPAIHEVVRWRSIDLVEWLHEEFAVSLDETTVGPHCCDAWNKLIVQPWRS